MKKFICVTEDAYKSLISTETKGLFENQFMVQLVLDEKIDEVIGNKLKNYVLNDEDKSFRIIKPLFNNENKVFDIALLLKVENGNVFWDKQ